MGTVRVTFAYARHDAWDDWDASMMRPFAEKILPEGWTLIVPEARYLTRYVVELGGDMKTKMLMQPVE